VPSPKVATYDFEAGNVGGRNYGHGSEGRREGEFDAIIMKLCECRHGRAFGKTGSGDQGGRSGGRRTGADLSSAETRGGVWMITADHGNAETMVDPATGGPHTYHTTNPVPFILVSDDDKLRLKPGGSLARHWRRPC